MVPGYIARATAEAWVKERPQSRNLTAGRQRPLLSKRGSLQGTAADAAIRQKPAVLYRAMRLSRKAKVFAEKSVALRIRVLQDLSALYLPLDERKSKEKQA